MMKFSGFLRYKFTADVYDYKVQNDNNGTIVYNFKERISLDFAGDPTSPRSVVLCDKPLRATIHLLNLKDNKGNLVMPGAEYSVTTVNPVLNIWGRVERYKMQVALSNTPTFEEVDAT